MMGSKTQRDGLIPRICIGLFDNIKANTDPNKTIGVTASYLEIYNEQVTYIHQNTCTAFLLDSRFVGRSEKGRRQAQTSCSRPPQDGSLC